MNGARQIELAVRRGRLLAEIDAQRDELRRLTQPVRRTLGVADSAVRGVRYLQARPEYVGTAVVVLLILSPRRAIRWARRGFFVWRTWRSVRRQFVADPR